MKNTTTTSAPTDLKEKCKAIPFVADLSVRDYFAAKAMQGMYANSCDDYEFEGVAEAAYRTADAMLAERNK